MSKCTIKILHNSKYGSWYRHCMKDKNHKGEHAFDKGIKESILKFTSKRINRVTGEKEEFIKEINSIPNMEQYIELQKARDMQSLVKTVKHLAIKDNRFLDNGKQAFDPNTEII